MHSIRKIFFVIIVITILSSLGYILTAKAEKKTNNDIKDTAIFTIDQKKNEIISLSKNVKDYMKLKFISVTTDQPIYWPNEEIFLKVLMPLNPSEKVSITLQKKDATPKDLGKFTLNDAGILVQTILSGKNKKIEVGEYSVNVENIDKKLQATTSFSVVDGSLGALSFGFDFEKITDTKKLEKAKGAWFIGNAAGAGKRWGNGLNVKNEIRYFNKPFTGDVIVKSRCYLSGCNGVEAGPPVKGKLKDGLLETVLDVSSHSGPFEIEVITDKGSIRHLFGQSGHVERQPIKISSNLTNNFSATLAPYQDTIAVLGREIYIIKEKETTDDAIEIVSPICDEKNKIELKVKKDISNPKIFILSPDKNDDVKITEFPLSSKLVKGQNLSIDCVSPYSLIAVGGWDEKKLYQAWGLVFTQSPIDIEMSASESTKPLESFNIDIKTLNRFAKKGVSTYGILEVFDNRVASKSAKEPLISSIGDSVRNFSNYLVSWRDWTGIDEIPLEADEAAPSLNTTTTGTMPAKTFAAMPPPGIPVAGITQGYYSTTATERPDEEQEMIREGEQKVVYCALVKTNSNGTVKVNVTSPPQTGRCKIRFVAINKFEYAEKIKDIDVKKDNFVEINVQSLLMPDATVYAKARVSNIQKDSVKLKISGACLDKELNFDIKPGDQDIEFPIKGQNYGTLSIQLTGSDGKVFDKREVKIRNVSSLPITFSDVIISDGSTITIEKGKKIAIYSNPAQLLGGIVMNITTTMYSWFGHSEALTASAAVRGILLRAMEDKIINDEGLRDTLKSDMVKTVKDLYEKFYDKGSGLFRPYPGIPVSDLWSIWAAKNLSTMLSSIDSSKSLKTEFAQTIKLSKEMVDSVNKELKKKNISIEENGFYDLDKGQDLIPVEINGQVVYKAITDDAVIHWYLNKMAPALDIAECKNLKDINLRFIKTYDTYRFLRAFERTGSLYYLLLNAKALFLKGDKNFYPLFNKIARGLILTQEPGMIQGPALLGGVYSAPQTIVKFLDLLVTMAKDKKIKTKADIEIQKGGHNEKITVEDKPALFDTKDGDIKITAPEFVTIRFDEEKQINIYEYLSKTPFFSISADTHTLKMGQEGTIQITLDKDKDPAEYYAIIAVPSTLFVRQTEDLLSDYKGQLLYGQKVAGGEKIQLLTVPFRGSRVMTLNTEASQIGESDGYVLVRHISNPDIIATSKIGKIAVK